MLRCSKFFASSASFRMWAGSRSPKAQYDFNEHDFVRTGLRSNLQAEFTDVISQELNAS